jgi:hypothetical protein
MYKRRKNRDLAQTILSRRYIPLEDKVLVQVLFGLFVIFFGLFHLAAYLERESFRERLPSIARQLVQALPEQAFKSLPMLNASKSISERVLLFQVPISSLPSNCKNQTGACSFFHQEKEFIVIHDNELSTETALALMPGDITNQNLTFLTEAIFPSSVAASVFLTLFLRLVFRRKFFASLDIITKVVFARKVFAATGSVAQDASGQVLDGRIHFFTSLPNRVISAFKKLGQMAKLAPNSASTEDIVGGQRKTSVIRLVRQPDFPRIPLEQFANDEFGHLALALEDEHARELRYEQLLPDLLESLPFPAATISRDSRNIYYNRRLLALLGMSETPEIQHPINLQEIIEKNIGLPTDLAKKTLKILDQSLPRMDSKEYLVSTSDGNRSVPVSVSSLNKFGKRVAIIIIHQDSHSLSTGMHKLFSTAVNRQVELVHELETELERRVDGSSLDTIYRMKNLSTQINLVSEILQSGEAARPEEITFNAPALIQNVIEQFAKRENLTLEIAEAVPTHVHANPSHLRQFLFLAIREISQDSARKMTLSINYLKENEELSLSFSVTRTITNIGREGARTFLAQLATVYGYMVSDSSNHKRENISYKIKVKHSQPGQNFLFLDAPEKLDNKHLLIIEQNHSSPISTLEMIQKIRSRQSEILSLEEFVDNHSNRHRPDVVMLLANSSDWSKDPQVFAAAKILRNAGIPTLLMSNTPRRGEYAEARALGFNGYLRRPFSSKELQSSLILLSSPEATSLISSRGLITRHTIHELTQEVGTALIAEFEPHQTAAAAKLSDILTGLSIKSYRATSNTEFFEEASRQLYAYIFYPSDLTPGIRRQVSVNLHGKSAICYQIEDSKDNADCPTQLPIGHFMVLNPDDPEEVLRVLRATVANADSTEQEIAYAKKSA